MKLRRSESAKGAMSTNPLKLLTYPLHAAYSRCLLQVMPFAFSL